MALRCHFISYFFNASFPKISFSLPQISIEEVKYKFEEVKRKPEEVKFENIKKFAKAATAQFASEK